jgi:hypothetical protein
VVAGPPLLRARRSYWYGLLILAAVIAVAGAALYAYAWRNPRTAVAERVLPPATRARALLREFQEQSAGPIQWYEVQDAVLRGLTDADPRVRLGALKVAQGYLPPGPEWDAALVDCLRFPDVEVRREVFHALWEREGEPGPALVAAFTDALDDPDAEVRRAALHKLDSVREPDDALARRVIALTGDADEAMRSAAGATLRGFLVNSRDEESAQRLLDQLVAEAATGSEADRERILAALRGPGGGTPWQIAPGVARLLEHGDPTLRAEAAIAVASYRWPPNISGETVDRCLSALEGADTAPCAKEAKALLARLRESAPFARRLLDPRAAARLEALRELAPAAGGAGRPSPEWMDDLEALIGACLADPDPEVRGAAVDVAISARTPGPIFGATAWVFEGDPAAIDRCYESLRRIVREGGESDAAEAAHKELRWHEERSSRAAEPPSPGMREAPR